jgi:hypothetical protein
MSLTAPDLDGGLRVVALLEATAADRHDAAFRVGEVDLPLRPRRGAGRLRLLATRFFPGGARGVTGGAFALVFRVLQRGAGLRAGFDFSAGPGQERFAFLAAQHFLGDREPVVGRRAVSVLGFAQQVSMTCAKLRASSSRGTRRKVQIVS